MDDKRMEQRLELPDGKLRMVLDTDTFNEVDDQFALSYAMLSKERLQLEAVYAAPFHNRCSSGPEDGMEKSYDEILRLLDKMQAKPDNFVFKGARRFMDVSKQPVESPAAYDLIEKALHMPEGEQLYVAAIAAITNVASAILLEPRIIDKIVVVWLGGNAFHWPTALEFNLMQDIHAVQVVLDSGVPLVLIPCLNVASHLLTTVPELREHVGGKNPLCDTLLETFSNYRSDHFAWAKEIWDISAIAYLIDEGFVPTMLARSPILTPQLTWEKGPPDRHLVKVACHVMRNPIFADLFRALTGDWAV